MKLSLHQKKKKAYLQRKKEKSHNVSELLSKYFIYCYSTIECDPEAVIYIPIGKTSLLDSFTVLPRHPLIPYRVDPGKSQKFA